MLKSGFLTNSNICSFFGFLRYNKSVRANILTIVEMSLNSEIIHWGSQDEMLECPRWGVLINIVTGVISGCIRVSSKKSMHICD
jgi:hypothetical protein